MMADEVGSCCTSSSASSTSSSSKKANNRSGFGLKASTLSASMRSCSADPRLITAAAAAAAAARNHYSNNKNSSQSKHNSKHPNAMNRAPPQLKIFTHVLDLDDLSNVSSSSDSELAGGSSNHHYNHNQQQQQQQQQPPSAMFRLSEKCLQIVETNLGGVDSAEPHVITLDPGCSKFVVVLVKRVVMDNNEQMVREAINYDYYEINHNIGYFNHFFYNFLL